MSDFIQHSPEGEPYFAYGSDLGLVVAQPENSTLYTHNYEFRGVDHLYTSMRDNGPSTSGAFLFRVAFGNEVEDFDTLLAELREEGFPEIFADTPDENDFRVFNAFTSPQIIKVTNKKIRRWLEDEQGAV